jgi:hypothetical protein
MLSRDSVDQHAFACFATYRAQPWLGNVRIKDDLGTCLEFRHPSTKQLAVSGGAVRLVVAGSHNQQRMVRSIDPCRNQHIRFAKIVGQHDNMQ